MALVTTIVFVMLLGAGAAGAALVASASVSQDVAAATLTDPTGPAATHRCTGGQGGRQVMVDLTWTPSTSAATDGYDVLRSDAGGPWVSAALVPGPGTATWVDTSVTFSTSYEYRIQARRADWRSPGAESVAVTTPGPRCR